MKQYPNTEVYLVSYHSGTYGSFITGLILLLLDLVPKDKKDFFSIHGNAHKLADYRFLNHNKSIIDINIHQIYDMVEPVDETLPLVMAGHLVPVWPHLFYYYPRCKNIMITWNQDDLPMIAGNLFFKTMIDEYYNEENPKGKFSWRYYRKKRSDFFDKHNINSPDDLTPDIVRYLLVQYSSPNNNFNESTLINLDNSDICVLAMSDILNNKNKILTALENVTGCRSTPYISNLYDDFLVVQEKLVKTKMPWIK